MRCSICYIVFKIRCVSFFQHHAKFTFDESSGNYYVTDFGSRNGTYLNGKRLSVAKQESEPHEVVHGSILQMGSTKLLCHIHTGQETCGHCEPGLVQQTPVIAGKFASCVRCSRHVQWHVDMYVMLGVADMCNGR
jgi:FOG: FHA domain